MPVLLLVAIASMAGGAPLSLAEAARDLPDEIAVVESWLRKWEREPNDFVVETQDCDVASCLIHVYPAVALELGADGWRGCLDSACATLELGSDPMFVIHATHWR